MYNLYAVSGKNPDRDLGMYPSIEAAATRARELSEGRDDYEDMALTDGTTTWYWTEDGSCHGGGLQWRLETPE